METQQIDMSQQDFHGNKKHLAILLNAIGKNKISIWNDWRSQNTNEVPILNGINLASTDLMGIDFSATDLVGADLSNANLNQAELDGAYLKEANLQGAKLHHATLHSSSFVRANLKDTYLSSAVFNNAKLKEADLSGAHINGIAYTDWDITDIRCSHIYTDVLSKERQPRNRDFEPGEFERLYKYHPTIDLEFKNGIGIFTILLTDYAANELNEEMKGFDFQVMEVTSYGACPVIKVEVRDKSKIKEGRIVLEERVRQYEARINGLNFDKSKLYKFLELALESKPKTQITFNGPTTIDRSIIGENLGQQNNQVINISFEQLERIEEELSNSNIPEKEKDNGKSILTKLKEKITEEGINQLVEWAKQLGKEAIKQLPTLLALLSR